ncbi:carbohydrate binding family 9 domain-containing protein, partial [Candidatus Latescibacterota bacterium]
MNKHIRAIIIVIAVFGILISTTDINAQNDKYITSPNSMQISACYIESPINMDGILNEPDWARAEIASGFVQREPEEGIPATEKTEVKILYDNENLYIGVMCFDSEPDKIIHNQMQVDGFLEDDDNFTVIFDTFNDKRGGFYFRTNPNGARMDAKIGGFGGQRQRRSTSRRQGFGGISSLGTDRAGYDWN